MKPKLMKTMVLVAVMSLSTDFFDGSGFILNNGSDYVNTEYMC